MFYQLFQPAEDTFFYNYLLTRTKHLNFFIRLICPFETNLLKGSFDDNHNRTVIESIISLLSFSLLFLWFFSRRFLQKIVFTIKINKTSNKWPCINLQYFNMSFNNLYSMIFIIFLNLLLLKCYCLHVVSILLKTCKKNVSTAGWTQQLKYYKRLYVRI